MPIAALLRAGRARVAAMLSAMTTPMAPQVTAVSTPVRRRRAGRIDAGGMPEAAVLGEVTGRCEVGEVVAAIQGS
ncbi:hypothetical protein GCM10014719_57000 [Planomonospora parontospora subsp. antibiotica]|nr:hypothetical protein GCM10014719_57000 [Planomonospora parontospora subsp. antibiotica]GII18758.1 hypothetical protein Ppa05_54840 [Planomonospora parontospora subsp. antibiotica]